MQGDYDPFLRSSIADGGVCPPTFQRENPKLAAAFAAAIDDAMAFIKANPDETAAIFLLLPRARQRRSR